MKKCTFAIAALAVILFAGCNKEEQTITLGVGGEVAQSTDKQAWCPGLNKVLFMTGDQILISPAELNASNRSNAEVYTLTTDVTRMAEADMEYAHVSDDLMYSYYATFEAGRTCLGDAGYAYYPAAAFDFGYAQLNVDQPIILMGYDENNPAMVTPVDAAQTWPMVGYVPEITPTSTFMLYNTCALISPAVKYGRNFLNAPGHFNIGANDAFPELTVSEITISCTQPISGTGYVQNITSACEGVEHDCVLVLNDNLANEITMLLDDVLIQGTTGANIPVLGNLPVPQMRGAQFSVNMKFNLDGVDYEYEKTSANVDLLRNRRQTLIINLFDADAWNYITEVRQFPL